MADLFDRLFTKSADYERIPGHYIDAALTDYAAGETTRIEIINYLSLDASAQDDLNALCDVIDAFGTVQDALKWLGEFTAVCVIASIGAKYTTKSAFRARMGLV